MPKRSWLVDDAKVLLKLRCASRSEARQWLLLARRVEFARAYLRARDGSPWEAREYQVDSLESLALRKVHCDGRDVGKTSEIEIMAAWAMVNRPNSELLIATQCENHLFPLMNRVARVFESTEEFAKDLVEVKRTPSWYFRFANGFVLWGRIAGPRGVNFQGLHVDWQIVDEAQEMTETAWGELFQALNGGGRRWVYGVPNGLRNTFYRMTQMLDAEQHRWPSMLNPEFDAAKDAELAMLYGGRTSPGYIHRVLGEHGAPAHAVFDLDDYLSCVDDALGCIDVTLHEGDRFEAPSLQQGAYYLGCDLGYARDPSEFVVYRAEGPYLANVVRVRLEGVNYARQQDVIRELDGVCGFRRIVIDAGSNGRATAHNLLAADSSFCGRLETVEFGGTIDLEPLPDGRPDRRPAKQFMTELLQRHMRERTIVFPRLPDRESQYAAHTYCVGAFGRIVYEKGEDHLIDADRCAALAQYLDTTEWTCRPAIGVEIAGFRF